MRSQIQNFLRNYLRFTLAELHNVDPNEVQALKGRGPDIKFRDNLYQIRFSDPVLISKGHSLKIWDFDLRDSKKRVYKKHPCDIYLLVGLVDHRPSKIFILPSDKVPSRVRISINGRSKYNKYEI